MRKFSAVIATQEIWVPLDKIEIWEFEPSDVLGPKGPKSYWNWSAPEIRYESLVNGPGVRERKRLEDNYIVDMVEVLLSGGKLPPISVQKYSPKSDSYPYDWRIGDGHHRYVAHYYAGLPKINAIRVGTLPQPGLEDWRMFPIDKQASLIPSSQDIQLFYDSHGISSEDLSESGGFILPNGKYIQIPEFFHEAFEADCFADLAPGQLSQKIIHISGGKWGLPAFTSLEMTSSQLTTLFDLFERGIVTIHNSDGPLALERYLTKMVDVDGESMSKEMAQYFIKKTYGWQ